MGKKKPRKDSIEQKAVRNNSHLNRPSWNDIKKAAESPKEKEFFFPDLNKKIFIQVPEGISAKEAFNESAAFIQTLIANNQLSDPEAGLNPARPTHAIVKDKNEHYRLKRLRMELI